MRKPGTSSPAFFQCVRRGGDLAGKVPNLSGSGKDTGKAGGVPLAL